MSQAWPWIVVAFVLGLAIGSFCNVVIYRLKHGGRIVNDRSRCPHCRHILAAVDLVPLVSWLALRGRCRYCHQPISAQYPLVELAMGIAVAAVVWRFGLSLSSLLAIALTAFLIVIFVYDLRYQLILDRVSLPAMVIALLTGLSLGRSFLELLLSGILGAGFFGLQYVLSRGRWIGGGDIRLGAVLGLALGWPEVVVALVLAYFAGTVAALWLVARRRSTWSSEVAFGTFLAAAGFVALLCGTQLYQWYYRGEFFSWFYHVVY